MKRTVLAVAAAVAAPALARADEPPQQQPPQQQEAEKHVPQPELEQEIVVVASRHEQPAAVATSAISVFGEDDFDRLRPISVSDVLREAPGTYVSPDGPPGQFTRVFLRGGASNQTLLLVDGIPQNDATAGGLYDFGGLTMTGVERVEVLRGSYSVLYGSEAIGGVVSVGTRRGHGKPSGYATAQIGSFGTRREEVGWSTGDENLDVAFAVGDTASDGDIDREEFRAHDAVGRFGVKLGSAMRFDGSLRVAATSVQSPYDFASSGVLPEDDNIGRRADTISGGGTLTWDATRDITVRATLSAFNVDSNFDNGPDAADPRDELVTENTATDLRGRVEATATLLRRARGSAGLSVTGGGEHLNQRTISTSTTPVFGGPGYSTTRLDDTTRTDSLFAQAELRGPQGAGGDADRWDVVGNGVVTAGYRVDDHSVFGNEGSPYVGARTKVLDTTVRSSYGEGFRAPKPAELFDPFVGNTGLGPETSQSFDVGASHPFFGDACELGVTWFRLDVDGLIAYDAAAVTPSRPFGQLTNFSRTRTDGFEYEAAADLGRGFRVRGAYTTQNPRDRDTGLPLPNRARRFGSAGVSYELGKVLVSLDGFFSGENGGETHAITGPNEDARAHPGRRSLVDLNVRWRATEALTVFGGLRNLLDDEWVATANSPAGTGIGAFVGAQLDF